MSHEHKIVPALMEPTHRVRYLKIIALFKIAKGVLLFLLGASVLFLNVKHSWIDQINDWADTELLLGHSKPIVYLLHKLEALLQEGHLRATALLAFFYCGVLFTEGIGVYMQKRWAEFLMILATAAFIPLEIRHLWHHRTLAALVLLLANCFIVWFLYLVLRREKSEHAPDPTRELVETR
jgi:uncharacterized membrane protein (DUF2068 family)